MSFYNIYVFVRLFVVILLDTFYDFLPDLECFSKFDQVSYEKWSYSSKMIMAQSTLTLHRINKTVP